MIYGRQSNAGGGEYLSTEIILWLFVITPQASRLVRESKGPAPLPDNRVELS